MKITILTLFPQWVKSYFESTHILIRAQQQNIFSYQIYDIRHSAIDARGSCDEPPYGGGAGMVIRADVLKNALEKALQPDHQLGLGSQQYSVIYGTPTGRPFTQKIAQELSQNSHLVFICGHYEGIDQRFIDKYVNNEYSIGDYVLSGGELPCLVMVDSVVRLLSGVINEQSLEHESFSENYPILEYPHYTRPYDFEGLKVPEVLLSGHHAKIDHWRKQKGLEKTRENRPDLLEKLNLDE